MSPVYKTLLVMSIELVKLGPLGPSALSFPEAILRPRFLSDQQLSGIALWSYYEAYSAGLSKYFGLVVGIHPQSPLAAAMLVKREIYIHFHHIDECEQRTPF